MPCSPIIKITQRRGIGLQLLVPALARRVTTDDDDDRRPDDRRPTTTTDDDPGELTLPIQGTRPCR